MTWLQQAIHVARKDLHMSGWFLAVYVFAAASAIPAAMASNHAWGVLAPIAVMLVGFTCAAFVVQVDSPYRPEVFWASKPLYSSAVWGGKLLFIFVVLVGIAVVAKAIALLAVFKLDLAPTADVLRDSVVAYGSFLAAALLVASLTPDLRALFLVCIAYLLIPNVTGYLIAAARPETAAMATVANSIRYALTGMTVTLLLPALIYRTRSRKLAIGVVVAYTVLMMFMPNRWLTSSIAAEPEPAQLPTDMVTPTFTVRRESRELNDKPGRFLVWAKLHGTAPHNAYVIGSIQARIRFADSTILAPANAEFARVRLLNVPRLPLVDSFTNLQQDNPWVGIELYLTSEQRKQVSDGRATVVVSGFVDVLTPESAITVPAREGARVARNGTCLRIDRIRTADDWINLQATMASVRTVPPLSDRIISLPEYALVNRVLGRAVELHSNGSSRTGAAVVVSGGESAIQQLTLQTGMPGYRSREDSIDVRILNGAELVYYTWSTIGRIPVSAPLTITSE